MRKLIVTLLGTVHGADSPTHVILASFNVTELIFRQVCDLVTMCRVLRLFNVSAKQLF